MYKLIALIGESGSGKDSVLREVLNKNLNFHKVINCTTRPKREGEKEGVNYFYLTNEEFAAKIRELAENDRIESLSITIRAWSSDEIFRLAQSLGIKELSVTAQFGNNR